MPMIFSITWLVVLGRPMIAGGPAPYKPISAEARGAAFPMIKEGGHPRLRKYKSSLVDAPASRRVFYLGF